MSAEQPRHFVLKRRRLTSISAMKAPAAGEWTLCLLCLGWPLLSFLCMALLIVRAVSPSLSSWSRSSSCVRVAAPECIQ